MSNDTFNCIQASLNRFDVCCTSQCDESRLRQRTLSTTDRQSMKHLPVEGWRMFARNRRAKPHHTNEKQKASYNVSQERRTLALLVSLLIGDNECVSYHQELCSSG